MANNRMRLRCTTCGETFGLAKYYPSTAWYAPLLQYGLTSDPKEVSQENWRDACENYVDALDKFFEDHQHVKDMLGTHFTLEYESQ